MLLPRYRDSLAERSRFRSKETLPHHKHTLAFICSIMILTGILFSCLYFVLSCIGSWNVQTLLSHPMCQSSGGAFYPLARWLRSQDVSWLRFGPVDYTLRMPYSVFIYTYNDKVLVTPQPIYLSYSQMFLKVYQNMDILNLTELTLKYVCPWFICIGLMLVYIQGNIYSRSDWKH